MQSLLLSDRDWVFSFWSYRPFFFWERSHLTLFPCLLWSWLPGHKHTSVHLQGLCWSSHLPEQPAWPTSAAAESCIHGKSSGTEHWAHATPCQEEVTDDLLLYASFQLQLLWDHKKSVCCLVHTWLTKTLGCSFTRDHDTIVTVQGKWWPLQRCLKILTGREDSSCSQDQGSAHPHAFFSDISKQERSAFRYS